MRNTWKRTLALLLALIMVFAIVACAKDETPVEETTAAESESTEESTTGGSETPGGETPGGETPGGETPGGETPGGETPGGETPGGETPGGETPGGDEPGGDEPGGDEPGGDEPGGGEPTPPVINDIVLVEGGSVKFAIICADEKYEKICETFASAMNEKTGVAFAIKDTPSASENAIYVGRAPKSVMISDLAQLTYSGYLLRKVGDNIHLTAHSTEGIQAAALKFAETLSVSGSGSTLEVKALDANMKVYNPDSYPHSSATVLGKDFSNYVVVLPNNYNVYDRFFAQDLIKRIGEDTGYALEYITTSKRTDKSNKIVVGKTNLAYSSTVYENLATDAYRIESSGSNVYIAYDNYLIYPDAIAKFCELYVTNPATVSVTQTMDYSEYMTERCEGTTVRLMSSNVTVLQDAHHYEKANGITWKDRMYILSAAYLKYLPDFVGLQEMQKNANVDWDGKIFPNVDFYAEINSLVGHKYTMLYDTTYATIDPILYLTDKWSAGDHGFSRFNAMHDITWCVFTNKQDATIQVIVINVHSAGNAQNAQVYNDLYKQLSQEYVGMPIFIMGDMNTHYGDGAFITTVKDTTLVTAGRETTNKGTHYGFDSLNHAMYQNPIDHIFVEGDKVDVLGYRFVNDRLMYISSGHRPIMADLKFEPPHAGAGSGTSWDSAVATPST